MDKIKNDIYKLGHSVIIVDKSK